MAGATVAETDVICTIDADLLHLTPHHLNRLISLAVADPGHMSVAILTDRRNTMLYRFPRLWFFSLSGTRAYRRDMLTAIPGHLASGYRLESALNAYAQHADLLMIFTKLDGVVHISREEKARVREHGDTWLKIARSYLGQARLLTMHSAQAWAVQERPKGDSCSWLPTEKGEPDCV